MQARIDVGAVVSRVFKIYIDQASVLMPAAAVVFVISGILTGVLVIASPALAVLGVLISLVATTLFTGMVVELVADVQDGRRDASVSGLLKAAMPVLGQLILVGILGGIGIVIGFVLLVVPGLILLTIWSVAAPVVVLEHPGAVRALGRSRELVRGNGWQVFGVVLVLDILVVLLASIVEAVGDSASTAAGIIVRVIVGILTAPLAALAASVLYFELQGPATPEPPSQPADGPAGPT